MTTIKIKFRPSSVSNKPGTLHYQISRQNKTRYITTNYRIRPQEWDDVTNTLSPTSPNYNALHTRITKELHLLHHISEQLEHSNLPYEIEDIIQKFKDTDHQGYVLAFMEQQIELLKLERRLGTAKNYTSAKNSFSKFLNGNDIPFDLLNEDLIYKYNLFLQDRDILRNSISFYMRILRSVHNKAIKLQYAQPSNPFLNVYTGVDHTRKRAIDEKLIYELNQLSLPEHTPIDLARDLFIFSYCTRGMAFVDIIHLKKKEIKDGMICYFRQKTHQPLYIRIEKGIKRIIKKYEPVTTNSQYVFPILKGDNTLKDYQRYQNALNTQNRMLERLSTMLSEECKLTSYVARHSWATAARNHNIPLSIISAGLGHTSEKTTRIYLNSLENSIIDSANLEIIGNLF